MMREDCQIDWHVPNISKTQLFPTYEEKPHSAAGTRDRPGNEEEKYGPKDSEDRIARHDYLSCIEEGKVLKCA